MLQRNLSGQLNLARFDFRPSGEENQIAERDSDIRVFELRPESLFRHLFSKLPVSFTIACSLSLLYMAAVETRSPLFGLFLETVFSLLVPELELLGSGILIGISVR